MSRSWVQLHRSADRAFRAAIDAAAAKATARLAQAKATGPQAKWRDEGGEELIVRGGNGRFVQVMRARLNAFTPRAEAHFLRALASTCNELAAYRATGLTPATAYDHRKRWPTRRRHEQSGA